LYDKGESITTIKSLIVTGDKLTLQLVENLQRANLTAAERESGIYAMCKNGLSQKEVAARLSKPETFISRNVSAHKVREAARAAGIDTSALATGTLNEIQAAAAAADYAGLVTEILQEGGTLEVARFVMENYRVAHGKPANPQKEKERGPAPAAPEKENTGGLSDPLGLDPLSADNIVDGRPDYTVETPPEKPVQKPEKKNPAKPPREWIEEFNPPHKQVDFNDICLFIIRYAGEQKIEKCPVYLDNGECKLCEGNHFCEAYYKVEAAKDIIALLHTEL
jgi:hypothetical protein